MKIFITGASKGIGKELALDFLEQGDEVVGLSRSLNIEHKNYFHYESDLKKLDSGIYKEIAKEQQDLDVIIINAGYGVFKELEQFSDIELVELMNVNFINQAILLKYLLPNLKKNKKGKIIFIGSEAALQGAKKGSIYAASKFALRGFAQSLRAECNVQNITVSLINPAMVKSDFYDELSFRHGERKENYIEVSEVVEAVNFVLGGNSNVDEINITALSKVVRSNC